MLAADGSYRFGKDESGAALIEFTLVASLFFLVVFGVVEFGYYFWQMGAVSKAAEEALRYAIVSNPVTADWATLQPNSGKTITCQMANSGAPATCSPYVAAADTNAMNCIVAKVQAFAPFVEARNVVIIYRANEIGLPGAIAPTIQLRLQNLRFPTIFLGFLGDRLLPQLNYTMTAEDMSTSAPDSSPSTQCGLIS